jgi:DNA-binding response OmpR family regulator
MTSREGVPYLTDPNGHEHRLETDTITIGRAVENSIVITSKRVSREHARIRREGRRWYLEDLRSSNGVFLNEERVLSAMELRDGDHIHIGDVTFIYHDPETTNVDSSPFPVLEIDAAAGLVRVNRKSITLSPKEYLLLSYLHGRGGQVCSKDEIGRAVWPEYQAEGIFDYQIENLVRRLRTRLEPDAAEPQLLVTVRGLGYKLNIKE